MPLPIPEIIRQNVWFDALGIGSVIGLGGWYLQGRYTSGRRERRHSRLTTDLGRPERRKTLRATAAAGRSGQEQAAALAAAVDALVAFVDAPPTRARAAACTEAIERLVKPEERGTMTVDFLRLHASGAPPARMQRSAEEVCVQMAVELRAIVSRVQAEAAVKPVPARPRPRPAAGPARAVAKPARAPAPTPRPRRTAWDVEEERIFAAGRDARAQAAAPKKTSAKPVPAKARVSLETARQAPVRPAKPVAPARPAARAAKPASSVAAPGPARKAKAAPAPARQTKPVPAAAKARRAPAPAKSVTPKRAARR